MRMTGRSVVPLTSSVNSTKPVARIATKRWISGSIGRFSVTPERQRQRDRAAHRAPHDHELVAVADPLRRGGRR